MKIISAKTFVVGTPAPHHGGAFWVFVKLTTDSGVEGIGEVYAVPFHPAVVEKMIDERKKANNLHHAKDQALAYCHKVKPYFDDIRYSVDKLELLVDDSEWELPKYREMLFLR
jgi:L-alanine-DL-glutamate epimerase-like enolase superfamily enzyme